MKLLFLLISYLRVFTVPDNAMGINAMLKMNFVNKPAVNSCFPNNVIQLDIAKILNENHRNDSNI